MTPKGGRESVKQKENISTINTTTHLKQIKKSHSFSKKKSHKNIAKTA